MKLICKDHMCLTEGAHGGACGEVTKTCVDGTACLDWFEILQENKAGSAEEMLRGDRR